MCEQSVVPVLAIGLQAGGELVLFTAGAITEENVGAVETLLSQALESIQARHFVSAASDEPKGGG